MHVLQIVSVGFPFKRRAVPGSKASPRVRV
jgi:hypothetical protein